MSERLADVILRADRSAVERRQRGEAAAVEQQRHHAALLADVARLASTGQLEAFVEELRGGDGG